MDEVQLGADLLRVLQGRGWRIEYSTSREPLLPSDVQQRYPRVPVELIGFLQTMESCTNAEENVWFLCREDYRRSDEQSFRWNEFELMCLETDDIEEREQIRGFWDLHFPFMLCVHSDYDYLAVSLDEQSYGEIVHGAGFEFEQTTSLARSFAQFLTLFRETAEGRRDDYPLSYFL
jgi:hypothetical protein